MAALASVYVISTFLSGGPTPKGKSGRLWLLLGLAANFGMMAFGAVHWDPTQQRSIGVHQKFGDCDVREQDWAGHRNVFVCEERHKKTWQDFQFRCGPKGMLDATVSGPSSEWYTLCGTAKSDDWTNSALVLILGCVSVYVFIFMHEYFLTS